MSDEVPSPVAAALAATMRAFDPALSTDDLEAIATRIDAQRALGVALAPKKRPLRNDEEPLTAARTPEQDA